MSPAPINPGRHARPLRPGETCRPCRVCGVTRSSRKKVNFVARRAAGSTGSGDVDRMASKTVTVQFSCARRRAARRCPCRPRGGRCQTLILPSGRVDGHLAQRGHETTGLATRGTDGSNPPPSSREVRCELDFLTGLNGSAGTPDRDIVPGWRDVGGPRGSLQSTRF